MEEGSQPQRWVDYVDWRGRAAIRGHHGGMLAASFVLVVEMMENLAYLANASNLVRYLEGHMHISPANAANAVTNFMGTAFLLALLGGFLSDAFFTAYSIYLLSALTELLGLVILTVQALVPSLKPPAECGAPTAGIPCQQVDGGKAAMLFTGLYLTALGVGGIKGSLPAHGAEQFDESTATGRKKRSTFFNYFVFCLASGGLIAVTLVVWMEDNMGWQWGFGISTATILLSIPVFIAGSPAYRSKIPSGSPLTTIFKVLTAAVMNNCKTKSPSTAVVVCLATTSHTYQAQSDKEKRGGGGENPRQPPVATTETTPTESLGFLNRAAVNKPIHAMLQCSVQQVEDVKIVLKTLPVFGCTIMLNCCLAQLSTFSVQQAASMDTKLGSFRVPPASLPIFPILFTIIIAPVYNHLIIPFARKVTFTEMGISHLQRIGIGLALSIIAMLVAALVEGKRKGVASDSIVLNHSPGPLPITFLWISFQYLFLGSADLFTLAGLMEFFFTEAPAGMKSLATALSWASLAMGYYLSSVIVSIINRVTAHSGHKPWLSGGNLNHYKLDRFYWMMCVLSGLNFLHYLFWACRYKYRVAYS